MNFSQKLWLTFLGIIALVTFSASIAHLYMALGTPRQPIVGIECASTESGNCLSYEKTIQTQVVQTHSAVSNSPLVIASSTHQPVLINFTPISPDTSSIDSAKSPSANQPIPPITVVPILETKNLHPADEWREFPVVPELSPNTRKILLAAMENRYLDLHTFVKVGDCHMESGIFLSGYVNGSYRIPAGFEETVKWFSESMMIDNITAVNGYGINTVLDPAYALPKGNVQCFVNETPLDCELRTKRPAIVLIAMGTNWVPNGEESFEKYLRIVVLKVLETGALPILATKTDNLEGDWKINRVIAQVSIDHDIPLVNIWSAMQDLPGKGLQPDAFHLTGNGWLRNSSTWLKTLGRIHQVMSQ